MVSSAEKRKPGNGGPPAGLSMRAVARVPACFHASISVSALRSDASYIRATILPAGVDMRPPIASCMRPSSTSRILHTAGTVPRLRKLRATISRSAEYSAEVKSDLVGILFMTVSGWSAGRVLIEPTQMPG
jgi:hypothetical protein